jgi:hypothetical protein
MFAYETPNSNNINNNLYSLPASVLNNFIQYKNTEGSQGILDPSGRSLDFRLNMDLSGTIVSLINEMVNTGNLAISNYTYKPLTYGNLLQPPINIMPYDTPIYVHYLQYIATFLFGHPKALAPIKNDYQIKLDMERQNLGKQFIDSSGGLSHKDASGNYDIILSIFQQLNKFSITEKRFAENSNNINVWNGMPFQKDDIITFILEMSGTINVEPNNSMVTSADIFGSINSYATITANKGMDVISKRWLIRIKLS